MIHALECRVRLYDLHTPPQMTLNDQSLRADPAFAQHAKAGRQRDQAQFNSLLYCCGGLEPG
jgi:hypothetical protein